MTTLPQAPIEKFTGAIEQATTEQLRQALAKGQRTLLALQMGDLADLRLADTYSDPVLDYNLERTSRVQQAVRNVKEELIRRGETL